MIMKIIGIQVKLLIRLVTFIQLFDIKIKGLEVERLIMSLTNNRKPKHKPSFMMQRQTRFQSQWAPHDKPKAYDAMEDKHATYYFVGRSIKKHMKSLRKAVTHDQRNQTERQRLKTLISDKIKLKLPDIFAKKSPQRSRHKIQIYSKDSKDLQSLQYLTRKSTRLSSHRKSTRFSVNYTGFRDKKSAQFFNQKSTKEQIQSDDSNRRTANKSFSKSKQYRHNEEEMLESQLINKKEHNKFMKFLQTKRQLVKKRMHSTKSEKQLLKIEPQRYQSKEEQEPEPLKQGSEKVEQKGQLSKQSKP